MIQIFDGHYGHHHVLLTPNQLIIVQKTNIAINTLNPLSIGFTRASIIVFLLRIIGFIRKWERLLWAGLVLNFAVMCVNVYINPLLIPIALILMVIGRTGTCITYWIICIPTNKYFYPSTPGWCLNRHTLDLVNQVFAGMCSLLSALDVCSFSSDAVGYSC